jgi:N-acetylneuraminate lyase
MSKFTGFLPAPLTPMAEDGSLNLDTIALQADYFKRAGAVGVFINGTTAEWSSLTVVERKAITAEWIKQGGPDFPVISHVGHHCQAEAIELAEHAASAGCVGISAIAPSYFNMESAQMIVDWCKPIAAAAGKLPFYYYDLPVLTGITIPADEVLALCIEQIPTTKGLKHSAPNPLTLQRCARMEGMEIFWGSDENLLLGLSYGATGAIGSTYNIAIPHNLKIVEAYEEGDIEKARALQAESLKMVEVMLPHGVMQCLKEVQILTGFGIGGVRAPFKAIDASTSESVRATIQAMGIIEEA